LKMAAFAVQNVISAAFSAEIVFAITSILTRRTS